MPRSARTVDQTFQESRTMSSPWDAELADLLQSLSATQTDLLALLNEKRALLTSGNAGGLLDLQPREEQLVVRLQACHDRRAELLERARLEGLPSDSIRSLAHALPKSQRQDLQSQVRESAARSQLLQHQSLANWVVVQRTLLHLSQVLEILATGGRSRPTYGSSDGVTYASSGGSFVDRAA